MSVGINEAVIVTCPRLAGLNGQVTENEFDALATKLRQPGINNPFALKVTLPAVEAMAVTFLACRNTRSPAAKEMVAELIPLPIVIVAPEEF
jgi:hypothetical protein